MSSSANLPARGRDASSPAAIPPRGWYDIGRRVWASSQRNNLGLIAAGVAFYLLLALFPTLSVLIALGGLFLLDPARIVDQLSRLTELLPANAAEVIISQAQALAQASNDGLSLAALIGFALAVFSATRGVGALISGLNVAYDEVEARGFLALMGLKLVFTVGLLVALLAGFVVIAALPAALAILPVDSLAPRLAGVGGSLVLALLFVAALALLYRFGPDRTEARWRWLSFGSVLATIVVVAASGGFALFIRIFGAYNESFGSLAGVVILLVWLWLSAYIVLLGATLNGEMEAQTRVDSTIGQAKPMGERGAVKADNLGRTFT